MTSLSLFLSFLLGSLMGSLYFGGLWYTVRQLSTASHPARLLLISFSLRLGLLLGAIYLLVSSHWSYLLAALAGVWLARTLLIRHWGPERKESI